MPTQRISLATLIIIRSLDLKVATVESTRNIMPNREIVIKLHINTVLPEFPPFNLYCKQHLSCEPVWNMIFFYFAHDISVNISPLNTFFSKI